MSTDHPPVRSNFEVAWVVALGLGLTMTGLIMFARYERIVVDRI
jgi:hypothetical protein